jgi:hypothetical protein
MDMRRKKGQSILEYVIVLTAIVAAIAYAARAIIAPAIQTQFEESKDVLEGVANRMPR